jgi:hypothetical protein
MKLPTLLAILSFALACVPAQAGWTLVNHSAAGSTDTNDVTTTGVSTVGANLIVVSSHSYGNFAVPTLTDATGSCSSPCNTWTEVASFTGGGGTAIDTIWFCYNPTTGASHTVTATLTGSAPSITMGAFSGAASSPLDTHSGLGQGDNTSIQATSAVGVSGELIISSFAGEATPTINDSFTITDTVPNNSGKCFAGGLAYLVTTGSINPTWSWTGSHPASTTLASFKPATGSPTMVPSIY